MYSKIISLNQKTSAVADVFWFAAREGSTAVGGLHRTTFSDKP